MVMEVISFKRMVYIFFYLTLLVVGVLGCGSIQVLNETKKNQMKIWVSPEYAPPQLARYPYLEVPVRAGNSSSERRYVKRDSTETNN